MQQLQQWNHDECENGSDARGDARLVPVQDVWVEHVLLLIDAPVDGAEHEIAGAVQHRVDGVQQPHGPRHHKGV